MRKSTEMTITEQGCHRLCSIIAVIVMGVMPPELCSVVAFTENTQAYMLLLLSHLSRIRLCVTP